MGDDIHAELKKLLNERIVVLDGYTLNPGDLSWDSLKQFGEVTVHDRSAPEG